MKKVFLLLGLAVGLAGTAQAQSAHFGIKAGASLTNFTGKGSDGADYKFGFNGGLVANFAVNDAFSVQPEVLFSMKGSKVTDNSTGSNYTGKLKLNYIDVPVLAHINAGGLFFELGPQIGFLASANASVDVSGQSISQDVKDQIKSVDFGYAAGLGYQVASGPGIGLRYNGGFTDISKGNTSNSDAVRNGAFQLYLTYMFGGK
ncbi:porin family protein [Hymenobacter psoromatis]|uniref:porin family protein n=1 Tax=Hymenobacter psoromatis TaxID=1484116 RepID=UPI001CC0FC1E|nr:porin family protein [Hymenobacter psoromatis]